MTQKTCKDCKYYMKRDGYFEENEDEGTCYRYPESQEVEDGYWCGEWDK